MEKSRAVDISVVESLLQENEKCLVVFDLDLTLWNCGNAIWIEMLSLPLKLQKGRVTDRYGQSVYYFPDVNAIIESFTNSGFLG